MDHRRIISWLSWLVISSQIVTSDASDKVDVTSKETVIYSKIGAEASLVYTIKTAGVLEKIEFTSRREGTKEQNFIGIAKVTFNKGDPVYDILQDNAEYKDRVTAVFTNPTMTVTVKNLKEVDFNTTFKCKAKLNTVFGEGYSVIKLMKADPPKIWEAKDQFGEKPVLLVRGANEEFVCRADGVPPPSVNWVFENKTVAQGQTKAILKITGASVEKDTGTYSCTAENSGGKVEEKMNVVISFIDISKGFTSITKSYKEGGEIAQECLVTGYPDPEYEWRKNGEQEVFRTTKTLTLKNLARDDIRNYTCTAKNKAGEKKFIFVVAGEGTNGGANKIPSTGTGTNSIGVTSYLSYGAILLSIVHLACMFIFQ